MAKLRAFWIHRPGCFAAAGGEEPARVLVLREAAGTGTDQEETSVWVFTQCTGSQQ